MDSEIRAISYNLKEKAFLLIADTTTELGKQVQNILKIPKNLIPVVRLIETKGGTLDIIQYQLQDEVSSTNIIRFIEKVQKGQVLPYKLSQEVPEIKYENKVAIVVGKNYRDLLYDKSKTVFMLFYAPWCKYSQEVLPIFDELAYDLREVPNLVFAKINGELNDLSDEKVKGFPTLRLYQTQ